MYEIRINFLKRWEEFLINKRLSKKIYSNKFTDEKGVIIIDIDVI